MALRNIVAAVALLLVGAVYFYLAALLPARDIPNVPGPSFFPLLIAGIVILLAGALLWRGVRDLPHFAAEPGGDKPDRRPVVMLVAFAAYIAVLPFLGFMVASIPFAAVLIRLYGGRSRILLAAVSIGLPVFLFLLFREVFGILLPAGAFAPFGG